MNIFFTKNKLNPISPTGNLRMLWLALLTGLLIACSSTPGEQSFEECEVPPTPPPEGSISDYTTPAGGDDLLTRHDPEVCDGDSYFVLLEGHGERQFVYAYEGTGCEELPDDPTDLDDCPLIVVDAISWSIYNALEALDINPVGLGGTDCSAEDRSGVAVNDWRQMDKAVAVAEAHLREYRIGGYYEVVVSGIPYFCF